MKSTRRTTARAVTDDSQPFRVKLNYSSLDLSHVWFWSNPRDCERSLNDCDQWLKQSCAWKANIAQWKSYDLDILFGFNFKLEIATSYVSICRVSCSLFRNVLISYMYEIRQFWDTWHTDLDVLNLDLQVRLRCCSRWGWLTMTTQARCVRTSTGDERYLRK